MSKLKNIFGIPQSLIDVANEIHETSHLSPGQSKHLDANKDGEISKHDFEILRNKNKMKKESIENLDEISTKTLISYATKAKASLKPDEVFPKREEGIQKAIKKASDKFSPSLVSKMLSSKKNENITEVSGTYPFKANDIAPFLVMLRSILSSLTTLPALRKIMKEETGLDQDNIESLINFFEVLHEELDLLEYRTKGAVGKKKAAAASTSSAPAPKKNEDDEEEDEGPSYEPASGKDQEHIMTQLKGAMDDERGGRHIDTSSGKKYVTKSTATKIHSHLMGLKAPERAQSSSDLYNLKATHPMTKHIQDDHRTALEKGIKPPSEKKGRGRPKKVGM